MSHHPAPAPQPGIDRTAWEHAKQEFAMAHLETCDYAEVTDDPQVFMAEWALDRLVEPFLTPIQIVPATAAASEEEGTP